LKTTTVVLVAGEIRTINVNFTLTDAS